MSKKFYSPSRWTRADALKVHENDPTTTQPIVPYGFGMMSDEKVFVWDTMPLKDLRNNVLSVDGWSVIFTLTADRDPNNYRDANGNYDIQNDWVNRHGRAYFTYWYSKDAKSWIHGGRVMAPGVSPTTAEWAGTPILRNDRGDMELYYTLNRYGYSAVGKVKGKIKTSEDGVTLEGFDHVETLFEPDGKLYQDFDQNVYANFRDPSPFIDPRDGKLYAFFEGNVAGKAGTHEITNKDIGLVPPGTPEPPAGSNYHIGCIGLAVAKDIRGDEWEMLPPLITAVGVNDQLERPHFVYQDGKYYLFTISHKFTYAPGLDGPDGVYGFVSDRLRGPYRPLNGSGLVLGNPSKQPLQTYSHLVMKNGMVTSFIDTVPSADSGEYRIGGVEAPTVEIKIKGEQTFIVDVHEQGYIPPTRNVILKK